MDEASDQAAQDLTLDEVDAPPVSGAPQSLETASSGPPSLELLLRLDDLSQEQLEASDEEEHKSTEDEDESSPPRPAQARRGQVDREAKRMESRLQRNLKQQQAQYARQRKLFEHMRTDRASSASDGSNSPDSVSSSEGQHHLARQRTVRSSPKKPAPAAKAKFRPQKEQLARIGSLSRQRPRQHDTNDDDDRHAQDMLRRIKDKARAEFHRQRLASGDGCTADIGAKAPAKFVEEMQQQEASSDALRRQLELLRRLQLENNRFRQETRSLRERNEALHERDTIRERDVKRLREQLSQLDVRMQRDQKSLGTAAQTTHTLKVTEKRLAAAQAEIRELQAASQEARDARDQVQTDMQAEIADLVVEVKRWKRSTKQRRQQEKRTGEELEFYKKTTAALEEEVAARHSQLKDAKRELAELSAAIEEKTAQCESVETSAADCVKQLEKGVEALQKTHSQEREKRKKVESARNSLQLQTERMQAENALLLDKQGELERQLALFQQHWKERKQAYQEQLRRYAAQLEEHVAKYKSDATTIGNLRGVCEALENRVAESEATTRELQAEVAAEARGAKKQVDALRRYLENALHDSSSADDAAALETPVDAGRSQAPPELQVIQAAISALRNEAMNVVHEVQRAHHLVRQQGGKLALAVERATELEHLREEDAVTMDELREQRKLAEQSREIMSQEKTELLRWSEQTCAKGEALEAELKKCGQLVRRLRQQLYQALEGEASWDQPESVSGEPLARSLCALEKELEALVSARDQWRTDSEKQSRAVTEAHAGVQALDEELATKADEFKQRLEDMERVHKTNAQEQKRHYEQCVADVESERAALETKLRDEAARLAEEAATSAQLRQRVDGFEQDVPVLATVLHLFVLVVQPLILQVSDLLFQRRFLVRENADFAQAHEQIECIGQVLKEMIPGAAASEERAKERKRRRVFRRVVIAVFAMNRLQHFSSHGGDDGGQSAYGLCAPLKATRSRKRACALSSQPTVIRVLPPQETLSRLSLRPLLERLKKMQVMEKVAEAMESNSGHTPSSLGSLVLKVVTAINPAAKELLVANTNGAFHCQALLERRRRPRCKRVKPHDDPTAEYECTPTAEEDVPTVALIRKRILALGKRVEDLHYQRNSLQKENYEFQAQLDQQATGLKDIERLLKTTEALQEEVTALRGQSDQELQRTQQERQAKEQEMQSKENELGEAQSKIEVLETQVADAETRIERMASEKSSLQRELEQLKSVSVEEEERADKSKAAARRQEDEVRSLKQAVKKAHELYQKVSWQLEQEVQEKATLQTVVAHLRRQQEEAQRALREEKLRELEKSFHDDTESDDDGGDSDSAETAAVYSTAEVKTPRSSKQAQNSSGRSAAMSTSTMKTSFAPSVAIHDPNQRDEAPRGKSRPRKCESSTGDALNRSECSSPSSSVSPVHPRVRASSSRRSADVANFLSEWQQLDVSRALSDAPPRGREVRFHSGASDLSNSSPVNTSSSPRGSSWDAAIQEQTPKSRRRVEIDKVNAAVHDYMDRIDDKLSKMYGIPPSSAIHRPVKSYSTERRLGEDPKQQERKLPGRQSEWEASSSTSSLKADEIRVQQCHSDLETYDD